MLTNKQIFWVTIGGGFAIWEASAIVRAAGKLLNRIYGVDESAPSGRSWRARSRSARSGSSSTIAAAVVVRLGPLRSTTCSGPAPRPLSSAS